jgi:rhodanese-related sulfurtransferase
MPTLFSRSQVIVGSLLLILVTFFVILLTPIRHISIITPSIHDVTASTFYETYKNNPEQYVFIDVRGEENYNRIHAQGSKSMPLHTLYDEWRNLPKNNDKTIVLICSGGVASGVGYHYLEHHGFFNIVRIEGGIEEWQLAGLPVVSEFTPEVTPDS